MTGDRARDISDNVRGEVLRRLKRHNVPEDWIKSVSEVIPASSNESLLQYGEELPVGLVWCATDA